MPERIHDYCKRTGQVLPASRGEFTRIIYESLALRYRQNLETLKALCGHDFKTLHIIGGGSKSMLFSQFTANACGIEVICGPSEATAIGNISAALISCGEITGINEARTAIAGSFELKSFKPENTGVWKEKIRLFEKVTG
jgi:sugar (pentulose or hexulose) kinase